jgi:hypothetical protein
MHSFFGVCPGCDNLLEAPKPVDDVEGPIAGAFDSSSPITLTEGSDRLDLAFAPSTQPRFLIVNELYNQGWSASAAGQDLAVYPTNVFMRGVLVPAGAAQVTFTYHSFLPFALWYTLGLIALASTACLLIRRGRGV